MGRKSTGNSVSKQLNIMLAYKDMTARKLAELLGTSPQALNYKIKNNTFTDDEFKTVCDLLGCKFVKFVELPDGNRLDLLAGVTNENEA